MLIETLKRLYQAGQIDQTRLDAMMAKGIINEAELRQIVN